MKRRAFLGLTVVGGVAGWRFLSNDADVDATVDEATSWPFQWWTHTDESGETEFNHLTSGGFNSVRWAENGDLVIQFDDNSDYRQWLLLNPSRNRVATGEPHRYGGTTITSLDYPLETGTWELLAIDVKRGDTEFSIEEDLRAGWTLDATGVHRLRLLCCPGHHFRDAPRPVLYRS